MPSQAALETADDEMGGVVQIEGGGGGAADWCPAHHVDTGPFEMPVPRIITGTEELHGLAAFWIGRRPLRALSE